MVGTYEGLLRLCECRLGGGSFCRWWGHLNTMMSLNFFPSQVVGTLKPSIISLCAVSPLFCPLFHPLFRPCFAPVLPLVSPPVLFPHLMPLMMVGTLHCWWLVRVTLVADWLFLPQNFGPVVGTYEGLLQLSEYTWCD